MSSAQRRKKARAKVAAGPWSTPDLSLTITQIAAGWADVEIRAGERRVAFACSYFIDTVGDLLRALEVLAGGPAAMKIESTTEAARDHEFALRREGDTLDLRVASFRAGDANFGEDGLRTKVHDELRVRSEFWPFLERFVASFDALLARLGGAEGYQRAWINFPLPGSALSTMRAALQRRQAPGDPERDPGSLR